MTLGVCQTGRVQHELRYVILLLLMRYRPRPPLPRANPALLQPTCSLLHVIDIPSLGSEFKGWFGMAGGWRQLWVVEAIAGSRAVIWRV